MCWCMLEMSLTIALLCPQSWPGSHNWRNIVNRVFTAYFTNCVGCGGFYTENGLIQYRSAIRYGSSGTGNYNNTFLLERQL